MAERNSSESISAAAANIVSRAATCEEPDDVVDLAKMCLADWFAVSLGALKEPAGVTLRNTVLGWNASGDAFLFGGPPQPPAMAALVNGTFAHCLDYDDVHFPSLSHLSAPTWAAVLALSAGQPRPERRMLAAFVAGFEIGGRLGSNGVGEAVSARGWHSTGVVGRLAATGASCAMLGLSLEQTQQALGLAATQTSGLTGSFGTHAKPFHAGRAAFDAVVSATLAANGFRGAPALLQPEGLSRALIQDGATTIRFEPEGNAWQIRRNALKPYACCGMTHATIDAGRSLAGRIGKRRVHRAEAFVHPLTLQVANKRNPKTSLEAKFSVSYCAALALLGHKATEVDFSDRRLQDTHVRQLAENVVVVPRPDLAPTASAMDVFLDDNEQLHARTEVSLGNPENPMTWDDLRDKFIALAEPAIGSRAAPLFETIQNFEREAQLARALSLIAGTDVSKDVGSLRTALSA